MQRVMLILILLIIISGCTSTTKWSRVDKGLMGTYLAVSTADALQTQEIFKDNVGTERNPILRSLGSSGIAPYFLLTDILLYEIANHAEPSRRKVYLISAIAFEACVVNNNYRLGITINLGR